MDPNGRPFGSKNQSDNGKYNLISVCFSKISKDFSVITLTAPIVITEQIWYDRIELQEMHTQP